MRTVVASGNDALNILFEAATAQNEEEKASKKTPLTNNLSQNQVQDQERLDHGSFFTKSPSARVTSPISLVNATQGTLKIWANCRFVKMGWFTAREAVTLIDL